jgi:ectoine hydroxylase-related dioxygenase (phytanoyl-CoA dioxygenase family)
MPTHHQSGLAEQIRAAIAEEQCQGTATREGISWCKPEVASSFIHTDGLAHLRNVLSMDCSQQLLMHVQERLAEARNLNLRSATSPFGDVLCRKHRFDLMLRADDRSVARAVSDALCSIAPCVERLLGHGTLLYECSALVSDPCAPRQEIHPDTPYCRSPVALTAFISLQDVTEDMGPTVFLPRSHTEACHEAFHSEDATEYQDTLRSHPCTTGIMGCGDAIVFDSRLLHCGSANTGRRRRVLFYLSFRRPSVYLPGTICPSDKDRWFLRRRMPFSVHAEVGSLASSHQKGPTHMGCASLWFLEDTLKSGGSSSRSMWYRPDWIAAMLLLALAVVTSALSCSLLPWGLSRSIHYFL